MFYQNCGSGIGTDFHFYRLLDSDVVKYTTGQLGTMRLRVGTLPSMLEMIGGVLLEVFTVVLFWVSRLKLCLKESRLRPKV